jgi:hypothetical protein
VKLVALLMCAVCMSTYLVTVYRYGYNCNCNLNISILKITLKFLKSVLPDFRILIFQFYFPVLYMVKTVQVPYSTGIAWFAENLLASQQ